MKTAILSVILLGFVTCGTAQSGEISIEQDASITRLLEVYKISNSKSNFYTIQVGFGSYSKAEELKQQVDIDFPDLKAKIIFDSPTYRVQIGQFRSKLEAERKFKEVRIKYPESLLLKPEKTKTTK
ncbi:SPOR domain-containing protein [uncultured Eudoraea sp.]|uniref:SPOR domain-containing protein n=1 Tax=uncultured Eudoraea sp. TaxID=1035614 RepID=UPI00184558C0|nr:SPOR domain-containing protein [uncultured Eudoraea sp.]MBT8180553.1 SPOR domain-containing protein [Eudoraea sp.]NNL03017.1 SPOR domain-containing protein [Eudoraea sp.]